MGNFMKWGRGTRLVLAILVSCTALALNSVQFARLMGWL